MTQEEKFFLTNVFRFFTQSDIDVAGGYINNYLPNFPQPELRMMLSGFAAREALHIAAYSHLIESLGMPETVYNEFNEYDAMREKHEFFQSKIMNGANVPVKIAAISAFTEGLSLFSSFIMLLNFPRHGKMKGMGQIVTWSIVDETMHTEGLIKLFRTFVEENKQMWNDETKSQIYSVCEKMVELEDKFLDLVFEMGDLEGLTKEDMYAYNRYIADRRLLQLGLKTNYDQRENPLTWIDEVIGIEHQNFFEGKATSYMKSGLRGEHGSLTFTDIKNEQERSNLD